MGKIIVDMAGKEWEINGCMSCEIANGNLVPFGGVLYQDEQFVITQDVELPINGFIIISSVRHIEKFTELTESEQIELTKLINKTLNILRNNGVTEEFNIILEEKKNYHFHIWLMPRHKWMIEKFGKVLKNIKGIQDYALDNLRTEENLKSIQRTCELLRKELEK